MQELSNYFDNKYTNRQRSFHRPISHIDSFYHQSNSQGALGTKRRSTQDLNDYFGADYMQENERASGGIPGNDSMMNLTSLMERVHHEEQQSRSRKEQPMHLTHRRTKIICTLGKHTSNFNSICELLKSGMNIAKINMASIQNKEHKILVDMIRNAAKITNKKCGVYVDLQGPCIRLGDLAKGSAPIKLKAGQVFRIYCKKKVIGNKDFIGCEQSNLHKKLKVGDHIIADHGKCFLKVVSFESEDEFLAKQAEQEAANEGDQKLQGRMPQLIQQRGALSTIGDLNKSKDAKKSTRRAGAFGITNLIDETPEVVDDTGILNYVRLAQARPLDADNESVAPSHLANDPSFFEQRMINFSETAQFNMDCDDKLIQQIIDKGRFSNKIAQALHDESKLAEPFRILKGSKAVQLKEEEETVTQKDELTVSADTLPAGENPSTVKARQRRAVIKRASSLMQIVEDDLGSIAEEVVKPTELESPVNIETTPLPEIKEETKAEEVKKPSAPAGGRRRRVAAKKVVKEPELKVIVCKAEIDGFLNSRSKLYFPELDTRDAFDLPIVDAHDLVVINSLIKLGVDFVTVSGVETRDDLEEVKDLLSVKGRHIKILAKVQSKKALANLDDILEVADGIVVARGYLGMEFQLEDIAFIQKYIMKKCQLIQKPTILSTEIMDSMITRLRPTRAEVSDISNAVNSGVDCCVLTGETSIGLHWKEATEFMARILYEAEQNQNYEQKYNMMQSLILERSLKMNVEGSMANCAVNASYMLGAKLIILFSNTGMQAIQVSKFQPQALVLSVLASDALAKNVMLHSGILYLTVGSQLGRTSLQDTVKKEATKMGLVRKGDFVIFLTGDKDGLTSGTNLVQPDVI